MVLSIFSFDENLEHFNTSSIDIFLTNDLNFQVCLRFQVYFQCASCASNFQFASALYYPGNLN